MWLKGFMKFQASDLHLRPGRPPLYRIQGRLVPAKADILSDSVLAKVLKSLLTQQHLEELEEKRTVDFSFVSESYGRFRCNIFYQQGEWASVLRRVPHVVPSMDELGIPSSAKGLVQSARGLVLVTGPTGSGKSTTLASLIQYLNERSPIHIATFEDPIEYIFQDEKATVTQRERGKDFTDFESGLRSVLRQDPDVIVLGEVRDRESIVGALTAAETGHLVLGTLHTNDAVSTIHRLMDIFPASERDQIRVQLASTLRGVIAQQLVDRQDGAGRILATELFVKNPTIEQLLYENKIEHLHDLMSEGGWNEGMHTLNQSLIRLVSRGMVRAEDALRVSHKPGDLKMELAGFLRERVA